MGHKEARRRAVSRRTSASRRSVSRTTRRRERSSSADVLYAAMAPMQSVQENGGVRVEVDAAPLAAGGDSARKGHTFSRLAKHFAAAHGVQQVVEVVIVEFVQQRACAWKEGVGKVCAEGVTSWRWTLALVRCVDRMG